MTDTLENYKRLIDFFAIARIDDYLDNRDANHAAAMMSAIFKNSKKIVRLFTGSLQGDISNNPNYLKEMETFLLKGGELKLIYEQFPDIEKSMAYKKIKHLESSRKLNNFVEYKIPNNQINQLKSILNSVINQENSIKLTENQNLIHFMVGDENMSRIEFNTDKYLAFGNFNNPKLAKSLISIFDKIIK